MGVTGYLRGAVSLLVTLIAVAGCTRYGYQLDPTAIAQIQDVHVQSVVVQDEIVLLAEEVSSAGQAPAGGLIIAGINANRERKAEKAVTPLRESVKDLDFRAEFWTRLEPALADSRWPPVSEVEKLTKRIGVTEATTKSRGLLEIETFFSLSANASYLTVFSKYRFLPRGSTKASGVGAITYESPRLGEQELEQSLAVWSNDGATLYRKEIMQGIELSVKMITRSLLNMGRMAGTPAGPKMHLKSREEISAMQRPYGMTANGHLGWVIEKDDERVCFQSEPGLFYSLPLSTVELLSAP